MRTRTLFTAGLGYVVVGITMLLLAGTPPARAQGLPSLTAQRWAVISNPVSGTVASASIAANASNAHVADCLMFSASSVVAPALTALTVTLRDGATGAGTVIARFVVVIPAATGQNVLPFAVCGLYYRGTVNTAMTLEFSAGLTSLVEAVTVTGYDVNTTD